MATNESSPAFSRLSRPGSGRGSEQYNAWDRSHRPGSGRGGNGNIQNSNSCSNSTTPSMSPTSPSGSLGLVPEHRIRNIPPSSLPIVPGGNVFVHRYFIITYRRVQKFIHRVTENMRKIIKIFLAKFHL